MYRSQAEWENGPEDNPEADAYQERLIDVTNKMTDVFTKDIRTTDYTKLGLQYIKHAQNGEKLALYPLSEVVTDYATEKGPFEALMVVLAKSDCPLVEQYRIALAEKFVCAWAADVSEFIA